MPRILFVWMMILLIIAPLSAQDDIPAAMPMLDVHEEVVNVLLMGLATDDYSNNPGLTDSMMIASLNTATGDMALLSVPRDLYVYVPQHGMKKLNQVYWLGELRDEERTGYELLDDTLAYNLGIAIDYHAQVNFSGFKQLIDHIGGITIAVDCAIQDWRLIEPQMDIHDENSYEMYTLWAGVQRMDGDTALWYVRSRRTSSDLDRSRRQQDVLRGIWRELRKEGIWENFPTLWLEFNEIVATDITLSQALTFLPIIADLTPADVNYYGFRLRQEVNNGYTTDEGRFILKPEREAIIRLMRDVVNPPTRNRVEGHLPTVALYNSSGLQSIEYVAAQRLEREGFLVTLMGAHGQHREHNRIIDHTGATKGSLLPLMQDALNVTDEGVSIEPQANRAYDYTVYIGANYLSYACTFPVQQPVPEAATLAQNG